MQASTGTKKRCLQHLGGTARTRVREAEVIDHAVQTRLKDLQHGLTRDATTARNKLTQINLARQQVADARQKFEDGTDVEDGDDGDADSRPGARAGAEDQRIDRGRSAPSR